MTGEEIKKESDETRKGDATPQLNEFHRDILISFTYIQKINKKIVDLHVHVIEFHI